MVQVEGDPALQLKKLARDLRQAGAVDLRKELYSGIQRAARPLIEVAKQSAAANLPQGGGRGARHFTRSGKRGGLKTSGRAGRSGGGSRKVESLAQRVSGASFKVIGKTGANPGVVLTAVAASGRPINLSALDQGKLRHPLFGNKSHWYPQQVAAGWWSNPMQAGIPAISAEVIGAIEKVAAKFYAGD